MSLLRDCTRQAETYDTTRAASPSVLGPLRDAAAGRAPRAQGIASVLAYVKPPL